MEIFLVHPGGPFWAKKDDGAWSIPKGEFDEGEEPLDAAKREFRKRAWPRRRIPTVGTSAAKKREDCLRLGSAT